MINLNIYRDDGSKLYFITDNHTLFPENYLELVPSNNIVSNNQHAGSIYISSLQKYNSIGVRVTVLEERAYVVNRLYDTLKESIGSTGELIIAGLIIRGGFAMNSFKTTMVNHTDCNKQRRVEFLFEGVLSYE